MEELFVEYMEDIIEKDPMEAYPPAKDVVFHTGDKVIDKWEQEIARGETPDIAASFENDAAVAAWLKPKKKAGQLQEKTELPTELEFHDDFTGGTGG